MKIVDVAGKTAVAVRLEFAVPIFGGEPDFDANVAIGGRSSLKDDPAKRRKGFVERAGIGQPGRSFDGRLESAGGNDFRGYDFCSREGEFGEGFASGRRSRLGENWRGERKKEDRCEKCSHGAPVRIGVAGERRRYCTPRVVAFCRLESQNKW